MPARYLLDTNTASYVIKGNFPRVREHLLKLSMSEVAISVVTEAELRFGAARKPEARNLQIAVEEFLLRLESQPWDSEAAKCYANLRADLERRDQPIGNFDLMIAAQALAQGLTLVTHDQVFRRVKSLRIQDWTI